MTGEAEKHGRFDVATIENDSLRVAVVPGYGAKVIDLTDKRTGRNWLVTGAPTEAAGDDAVFGGPQAYGWDECFPTVAPCPNEAWGAARRDHGALWGRPWRDISEDGSISTRFDDADFAFSRRLVLDGSRLSAHYALANRANRDLAYLWSAHPLLDLDPGEVIELPNVGRLAATYLKAGGRTFAPTQLDWPVAGIGDQPIDLARVHAADKGFAAKLYCDGGRPDRVVVGGANGRLTLTWQPSEVGSLGLWLDYGGWPDVRPVHQVALEPTTAPADDLQSARGIDRQRVLKPGQTHRWWIAFAFEAGPSISGSRS